MYGNMTNKDAVAVTPNDGTNLPRGVCNALYIGGAGAVAVTTEVGSVVTFAAVPVGTMLQIRASKVMATNTTATLILAMY